MAINVSGPQTQSMASIRYPPALYIGLDNETRTINFPQLDLDWQLIYNAITVGIEDWMLEVRLWITLPKDV
jgi:hypothetical protein